MNVPKLAEILKSDFIGFAGGVEGLFVQLCSRRDFVALTGVPRDAYAFQSELKLTLSELLAQGIALTIHPSGKIAVESATTAQHAQAEEAMLRTTFRSATPEAAELRAEFGNSEDGFQRFAAYQKAVKSGRAHPPRRGKNVIDDGTEHASVDPRLTIEARSRQRWELEPVTRSEFGNNFERFLAFEKANSRGQVHRFVPA